MHNCVFPVHFCPKRLCFGGSAVALIWSRHCTCVMFNPGRDRGLLRADMTHAMSHPVWLNVFCSHSLGIFSLTGSLVWLGWSLERLWHHRWLTVTGTYWLFRLTFVLSSCLYVRLENVASPQQMSNHSVTAFCINQPLWIAAADTHPQCVASILFSLRSSVSSNLWFFLACNGKHKTLAPVKCQTCKDKQ